MIQLKTVISASLLAITSLTTAATSSNAQPSPCDPPRGGEYLLLIISDTPDKQAMARRALPEDINSSVCRYLNDTVTRVGGFQDPKIADDWARYIQELVQLPAFVVQAGGIVSLPPQEIPNAAPIVPAPTPVIPPSPQNPVLPAPGYAVLVDYLNRPELAHQIRQALGQNVDLVSYGQRPYLLAAYTPNPGAATATLQTLSERGFLAIVVDSRLVTFIGRTVN